MSLHRIEQDGSVVWRVRWRDGGRGSASGSGAVPAWRVRWRDGGRGSASRSRTFTRKADAQRFEDELRRRRRLGEIGLLVGSQETLEKYVVETWAPTHAVTLAPATGKGYAALYDAHIGPCLGHLKLIEITPEAIARWQSERIAAGAGRVSMFKAMTVLGSILQRALEAERISRNPARLVRKARRPPRNEVRPVAPAAVEAMRAASSLRDATLISVLAYAGLRPREALELRWRDVGQRTLMVNALKTGRRRNVRLLTPLRKDLDAWKKAEQATDADALLFPSRDGEPWD